MARAKKVRLIVCGAAGKMGTRVTALAARDRRFKLVGKVDREGSGYSDPLQALAGLLAKADVLIDFSAPDASVRFAAAAASARKAIVIGTTGFSALQREQLKGYARRAPIFLCPNFSRGVFVMLELARLASKLLPGHEARITETHHTQKKDAPSGTALRVAQTIAGVVGGSLAPITSHRVGDVVGEHTLTLTGPEDTVEITHRAHSRDIFAAGALTAAHWVADRQAGLYDMPDLVREAARPKRKKTEARA